MRAPECKYRAAICAIATRANPDTMRHTLLLVTSLIALSSTGAAAGSLNKCIDTNGQVTYSNLPCGGSQEARKLAIDPAPLPEPVQTRSKVSPAKPAAIANPTNDAAATPETRHSKKSPVQVSAGKCNTLAEKLGRVIDKMDTARRQGYTQAQMDDWNQQVRDLERQKQQAGCF